MALRHKHADVIIAWANGEEVEIFYNGQWIDAKTPNFCAMYEYRIKPKIVKREGWVNVYKTGPSSTWAAATSQVHHTEEDADKYTDSNRVACIRIEWEEEQ